MTPSTTRPSLALRAEALVLAAVARVVVRAGSLKRAGTLLARIPRRAAPADPVASCLAAARDAAARAAHPTCLYESLIAFALLARRGYAVELHLGAKRSERLEAHAWISIDGRPCGREAIEGYTEIWHVVPASPR